ERINSSITPDLNLIAGIQVSHYDIIPKCTIPGGLDRNEEIISQGAVFEYYTEQGNPDSRVVLNGLNNLVYQNLGLYAETNWQITPSFQTIAGIRYDLNTRYSDTPLSPRLAAIYKIKNNLTAKYIFTRAFVAPSPYYAYLVWRSQYSINIPNPDLSPEKMTSNEICFSYDDQRQIRASLSLYYNQHKDHIIIGDRLLDVNIAIDEIYLDPYDTDPIKASQSANAGESS
ncbi:MAG: TonB-dependent receptor, partial [Planctomycetes bacterium]|nr:TonB-dependent receptor [Planctomycetota bacterium]